MNGSEIADFKEIINIAEECNKEYYKELQELLEEDIAMDDWRDQMLNAQNEEIDPVFNYELAH